MFNHLVIFFLSFTISSIFALFEYQTLYVDVDVDHYTFVNEDKFKIKVLLSDIYWKDPTNGPILAYFGGTYPIESYLNNTGYIWEAAAKLDALVLFIEHRYAGNSLPYGENSFLDRLHFGYLTVEQTLGDIVQVLFYIDSEIWRGVTIENPATVIRHPIIPFGGSYGGQLAAWMRSKYAHVVVGSLAASPGLLLFPGLSECGSFYQAITQIFGIDYSECPNLVKATWEAFYKVTGEGKDEDGKKWLSDTWKLCKPIATYDDVDSLVLWIWDILEKIAMANYPYEHNFIMPLPPNPVKLFCSKLIETTTNEPKDQLTSMFNALNLVANHSGDGRCFGNPVTTSDPSKPKQIDLWSLQNCMEMVIPVCADGVHDMFMEQPWDLKEKSDECFNKYGVQPDPDQLKKEYGGRHLEAASNIIISKGTIDPWNYADPKTSISETVVVVELKGAANHLDLMASNEKDPEDVTKARKLYEEYFVSWIAEFRNRK